MAAEGGPVAGGSGRKGNVDSEGNSAQEDEEGGGNTAGEGHNPTSGGALTAPTRQDQSSSDPLRSDTCNPSGSGSASAARMRASGPESLAEASCRHNIPTLRRISAGSGWSACWWREDLPGQSGFGTNRHGTVTGARDGEGSTAGR
ncbi:hypothetical protein TcBrA4_0065270 [Trypanosoma cruzi]|nr:hypothetical protein TcBrA4_0065270 [Trypanosoma cruzi]